MTVAAHKYYRMFDPDPSQSGAVEIDKAEAKYWNERSYGIFWSVNTFDGARRIENLVRLNALTLDLDEGTKEEQMQRIKSGLIPSLIIETKRGYQIYFLTKDATTKGYRSILLQRLVPFYGADRRATDIARILRVPGFYHCKDPNDRFLVKTIHRHPVLYSEQEICLFYKPSAEALENESKRREFKSVFARNSGSQGETLWERVWDLDCEAALSRLSSHPAVSGESYTFRPVANGNLNILVDGKSTSCWIDREKRIGSLDQGGPTIYNWINWYHRNPSKTISYMKEVFPELWKMKSTNQQAS